ncbi:MAG: hypothetical protein GYB37_07035 [Algicola sp.]|nr:hypothetical protein [Algicola sp.]
MKKNFRNTIQNININRLLFVLLTALILSCDKDDAVVSSEDDNKGAIAPIDRSYAIDQSGVIPENVLQSYLSRAITMAEFATPDDYYYDAPYPYKEDDVRMILNIGAKFIGRATYMWGTESRIEEPMFLEGVSKMAERIHGLDPDIILQAAIFEIITTDVDNIEVPEWVFEEFGEEYIPRNFSYQGMVNLNGTLVNHWSSGASVPDVSRLETKMWFFYLAKKYIDAGIEAIHFGQVELMAMEDANNSYQNWKEIFTRVRNYAKENSPRGIVLLDGHVPRGGLVADGDLLLDFHSFPLRAKETPGMPQEAVLEKGFLDAFYGNSRGGVTPSGWETEHLPYLVEFDNYGVSDFAGQADIDSSFIWGYDEITWYALQPEDYRNQWLEYAWDWIRDVDPNGFLQMPGNRKVVPSSEVWQERYRANSQSWTCPEGYGQEETIKAIWERH